MAAPLARYHRAPGFLRRDLASVQPAVLTLSSGRQHTAETIFRAWAEGKSEHTLRAYENDLADFALFFSRALGISPPLSMTQALDRLFRQSSASAHEIALAFRNYLDNAGMAPASINRHLATLRSFTRLGRMLGVIAWRIEMPGVKMERRRDTRGPSLDVVRQMLEATAGDSEAETRDRAIVLVMVCLGLRVAELCGLNVEDVDLATGSAWIRGKGRRERELVPLPANVVEALQRYARHRGDGRGPLFRALPNRAKANATSGRLETRSVLRVVRKVGQRVGKHVWCHALRHTAITTAIDRGQKAGVGLDQVRAFSRHRQVATMLVYRDDHDREVVHRTLTSVVADAIEGK